MMVLIQQRERLSVRPSGPDRTGLVCHFMCVCPSAYLGWTGLDQSVFFNHSRNHVFVQLDQAVCLCVRPSGLDCAIPNFSSQDCLLMFIAEQVSDFRAFLCSSQYCRERNVAATYRLKCGSVRAYLQNKRLYCDYCYEDLKNTESVSVVIAVVACKLRMCATSLKKDNGKL